MSAGSGIGLVTKTGVNASEGRIVLLRSAQLSNNLRENDMLKLEGKNLGTAAVLCLQGQIVNGETEVLRNAVDSVVDASAVILDLARVTTLDAHGLGVMLELRQRVHEKGIQFELMNVAQPLMRVFEITHLDSVFQITSGLEFFSLGSTAPAARASDLWKGSRLYLH